MTRYICNDCDDGGEIFTGTCELRLPLIAAAPTHCPVSDEQIECKWRAVDEPAHAHHHHILLSDEDVNILIAGLLGRVTCGESTGEDHGPLLSDLKKMAGITW